MKIAAGEDKTLSVRLPVDLAAAINQLAYERRITVSVLVRQVLAREVADMRYHGDVAKIGRRLREISREVAHLATETDRADLTATNKHSP